MQYTFSDGVRSILSLAVEEADALHHDYLGTGHILLALLRDVEGPAADILAALQVDREDVRRHLLKTLRPGNQMERMGERPYTARAKRVLESAMASTAEFGGFEVRSDNLLIGLASLPDSMATQALASRGVNAPEVINEARRRRQ